MYKICPHTYFDLNGSTHLSYRTMNGRQITSKTVFHSLLIFYTNKAEKYKADMT